MNNKKNRFSPLPVVLFIFVLFFILLYLNNSNNEQKIVKNNEKQVEVINNDYIEKSTEIKGIINKTKKRYHLFG